MNSLVTSIIRTWTPMIVGAIVAWLAAKGIKVDAASADGLVAFLTGLFSALYYLIARFLEAHYPKAGWLLGVPAQPNYVKKV